MPIKHTLGPGDHGYLKDGRRPKEYEIWSGLFQRCDNPRCREYPFYGGRGITVCARWRERNGFANFLADVGPQPFPRASLHRLDNDGNYEPGNVVWATSKTQMRHTRANHVLTLDGNSLILVEWAELLAMKPVTLSQRLYKGWSVEKALTTPVKPRKPYYQWNRNPNAARPGRKPRCLDEGSATTSRSLTRSVP